MTSADHRIPATADPAPERIGVLDVNKCYRLLAGQSVGRVVYTDGALPAVAPVNFVMDGHHVVFRTTPGSRLARGVTNQVVAFEVDQLDAEVQTGWSVVVTGIARPLTEPGEMARALGLGLAPWAGGRREQFLSITPGLVTGRFIGY